MRDYGIIATAFWTDDKMPFLSDQARLLAIYLLAGPHSNLAGMMRIPAAYVADDLRWSIEKVDKSINELKSCGFINRSLNGSWTVIKRFLNHNSPQNPNQWKAVESYFMAVPTAFWQELDIPRILKPFAKQFRNRFEIQEQEQEQEQDLISIGDPMSFELEGGKAPIDLRLVNGKSPHAVADQIFESHFWPDFPKERGGKQPALVKFRAALKHDTAQNILDGMALYRRRREQADDPQFTKRAATWLNQRGWKDELAERDRMAGILAAAKEGIKASMDRRAK